MIDWTQLQKDVEAHNRSRVDDEKGFTKLELAAPDLAVLALAGRRLASAVDFWQNAKEVDVDEAIDRLCDALDAFREAEKGTHDD